jgi:plastocyanin
MRRSVFLTVAALAALALIAVSVAQARPARTAATITGTVGPGFTISMNKTSVKAGTYTIKISDKASIHNFHLTGAGVNKSTSVSKTGTTTWTVKLKKGTYKFVCDPHASQMKGTLKVT